MLDGWMRRRIDPPLDRVGQGLARAGVSADAVTALAFALGLAASLMIVLRLDALALFLFLLNRTCDGFDGAISRGSQSTDRGGFLDVVFDFAVYGTIPLAFALREPGPFAVPAAVLLLSFYINGASFLAFAAVAAKRGLVGSIRGVKSIYFTAGFMEGTETILFFVTMILAPQWFPVLAYAFAGLTLMSALARIVLAWNVFRDDENSA
ncbi:CDP-alcohol phosphatidyltransferase family protein [Microvirga alba]|uniref:CDP-alcohol phosphatidyltransferase family protein n=1 Tax=Microvirga alba TaxID=2791025 RepID=A0A931FTQ7_9HYPH|nr:CDP-alcohol phosphatidyltransferase family protein [Microvirga alba]MBF9234906.1 CDP-alcohol phosphatidyltransferase family protein [Microvirga alba]